MRLVRSRRALLLGALAATSIDLALVGCSSDKPQAASSTTSTDAAPNTTDATRSKDGGQDADAAGDAADEEVVKGSCLDDEPAPTDGGADGGDGSAAPVCPSSGTCSAVCAHILDHYKLGVAQVAITCLLDLPSCSTTTDVLACVDTALGMACADPTSNGYCSALVKACDPNAGGLGSNIDETGCESFANGLSSSGRSAFASCLQSKIDAGTCPAEVVACADEIRQ